jgi:hypothetical protein
VSRGLWALIVWLGLTGPATSSPTVRALFVGVNHYARTDIQPPDALFNDLHGSVNDIAMVKTAFATAYGLPVDTLPATGCEAPGGVSVTLLDGCATGAAIMAAFRAALKVSSPGDIVLFYFAGHGGRFRDEAGVKPTGWNSSILQSDARKDPNDAKYADIMGAELAVEINKASRRGVNVVTLFDSCNSGTASRALKSEAQVRMAPPMPSGEALRPVVDPGAPGRGYIVHFGAAADGTPASEKPMDDKKIHGVFSWALAQILLKNSRAGLRTVNYQDVFDEIQRDVVTLGFPQQQPRSEGDLAQPFLGRAPVSTATAPVTAAPDGGLTLASGALSGVTMGSTYGLFANDTEAASGAAPSVQATVTQVGPYTAQLTASPKPAIPVAWARELQHKVAIASLRVQVQGNGAFRAKVAAVLSGLDLVQLVDDNPRFVIVADGNKVHFLGVDGSSAGKDSDPTSSDFAETLTLAVKAVAEYEAVFALRDGATGDPPTLSVLPPDDTTHDPATPTPHVVLNFGVRPVFTLTNTAAEPRYLYLLGLGSDYSVVPLFPVENIRDASEIGGSTTVRDLIEANSVGRSQLLLLSTPTPIDVVSLRTPGLPRSIPGPPNPLETLLQSAKSGTRTTSTAQVASWSATMVSVDVLPNPAKP